MGRRVEHRRRRRRRPRHGEGQGLAHGPGLQAGAGGVKQAQTPQIEDPVPLDDDLDERRVLPHGVAASSLHQHLLGHGGCPDGPRQTPADAGRQGLTVVVDERRRRPLHRQTSLLEFAVVGEAPGGLA